jgi:hypothetical protein
MTESSQSRADIDNKYDVTKERTEYNNKTASTLTSGLQLKPYVKKRRMTEEVACTKSNNGHDFPHVPSASLPHVNPYVREMNGTENIMQVRDCDDSVISFRKNILKKYQIFD